MKPPPPLDLADCWPKKWKLWKQAWLNLAIVSKISTQNDSFQKALFLYTIGQSALEIYSAFQYNTSDNPDKEDTIIAKFDEYFMGDVNETYERFNFNQRNQKAGDLKRYMTHICDCIVLKS